MRMLQKCYENKPVIDEQIRNSVVGDDRSPVGHLCPSVQRKHGEAETNVGCDDLLVVALLEDDCRRVEVCERYIIQKT